MHRQALTVAIAGVMLSAAACAAPAAPATPATPTSLPARTVVTVKMGHLDPPSLGLAPMLIAQEKGYFADQGVTLEPVGFANTPDVATPLAAPGLSLADVDLQLMGFPNMLPALLNGSIDAGWEIEFFLTQAIDSGSVVVFKHGEEFVPGAQLGILALSSQFASDHDAAARYLAGWLEGARLYNDAFGKKDPRARNEVYAILKKRIPNMTDALLDHLAPSGIDPDGKLNLASLQDQQAFFVASGSQQQALDIRELADASFAEDAVKRLGGPYQ